ncbi:hypothetical protein Zmor_021146 [Zophobas morio]|uniref:C2H2-type domain-containing protein n=2 Tax=Zophobas morio TaxID=2755281 RepID=A0AA38I5P1_9CUCU|nr:hypothetical protein Zmor_021146 [Zophobas morio]
MRHVRLTGQNIKKLASFKNQIGGILRELNKFDKNEKTEAVSYIQSYIDNDSNAGCSTVESDSSKQIARKKKVSEKVDKYKVQKKKYRMRFSTNRKLRYSDGGVSVRKIVFKCKVCDGSEKTRKLMLKHLQTHVGTPRSCIKCKRTFNGSVPFKWHVNYYCKPIFYGKWKYKCNLCPREFISKRTLESHIQGHKRNSCAYCDKILTRRVQLVRHLLEEHSIKLERDTYKCDYCEKRYIKKCSLYYHLRQHLPDKYVCLECGKVNNNTEEFEEHKKQHDLHKHFTCSKCGDKFSRRQQYLYHLKRHNQYKCITCNECYASRLKAIKHKQQGHQVEGLNPRFICPHCPIAFHRESRFHIHMRKHTEENRTVNCKYCKKTFNSPYAYYKHCITINHEKFSPEINDIACNKCGKHFAKRYDLRQHMYRVHNISKQFVSCQHCDYKTVHKCNMDRHVALHFRKENQYTCEYCGKSCDSIASLNDHITYNHIQTKQFKCDKCDKAFKRNSELVRHQDSHSDERPHVCTLCGKSYKRLNHLKRHEQQAHQIVKETRRIKKVVTEPESSTSESGVDQVSNTKVVLLQPHEQMLNFSGVLEINGSEAISEHFGYFLADRGWNLDNEDLNKVYSDVSLNYGNHNLCGSEGQEDGMTNIINNGNIAGQ